MLLLTRSDTTTLKALSTPVLLTLSGEGTLDKSKLG